MRAREGARASSRRSRKAEQLVEDVLACLRREGDGDEAAASAIALALAARCGDEDRDDDSLQPAARAALARDDAKASQLAEALAATLAATRRFASQAGAPRSTRKCWWRKA